LWDEIAREQAEVRTRSFRNWRLLELSVMKCLLLLLLLLLLL
jgi:hypothetical protein